MPLPNSSRRALARDFRVIDPRQTRVLLIEAGQRLLANFPEALSRYTADALRKLGVEVRLGQPVTHCDAEGVRLGDEFIRAGTVVWAAGVRASPAARWLGLEQDRAGRVAVAPDLRAPGHEDIYVIGDTAAARNPDGTPQPGIAPVAKQQGAYVARAIEARIEGRDTPPPFAYRDRGLLATIGRKAAVIAYRRFRLSGLARVVDLGCGTCVLSREPAQSPDRRDAVAVVLRPVRAWRPPDNWIRQRLTSLSCDIGASSRAAYRLQCQ